MIASWPHGESMESQWEMRILVPDDLSHDAEDVIISSLRSRGYGSYGRVESWAGLFSSLNEWLVLADPVELQIETRSVAQELWLAGIPFASTVGNSCGLVLPRRAIPAARAVLSDRVPQSGWGQWR